MTGIGCMTIMREPSATGDNKDPDGDGPVANVTALATSADAHWRNATWMRSGEGVLHRCISISAGTLRRPVDASLNDGAIAKTLCGQYQLTQTLVFALGPKVVRGLGLSFGQ
jgi:hypothetical protein